jgi:ectoine hydroxylase-related dioxygenase (phytanoyl-CoA dioxygenase family)
MTYAHARTASGDVPVTKALSATDREELQRSYAEDGYVVLRNVVAPERLKALCRQIVEAFRDAERSGGIFAGGGLISGHLNCFPGEESRFVYEALVDHGIIDLVRTITPRPFVTPSVRCNFNLPKSVAQHRHMDGTFLGRFTIVNVAAMDTDLINGAIELLPGTHKKFYPYWRFAMKPRRPAKRISMSCGDVLVRSSTLWHRGMPNRSAAPRPMLAMTFGDKNEQEYPDPFRQNDGKIAFYENWYKPTRLGRLRERTFVAAPITYDAYRFVSSVFDRNKLYGTP